MAKKSRDIRKLLITVEGSIVSDGLILNCSMSTHMFAKKDYLTISILKESNYFILWLLVVTIKFLLLEGVQYAFTLLSTTLTEILSSIISYTFYILVLILLVLDNYKRAVLPFRILEIVWLLSIRVRIYCML